MILFVAMAELEAKKVEIVDPAPAQEPVEAPKEVVADEKAIVEPAPPPPAEEKEKPDDSKALVVVENSIISHLYMFMLFFLIYVFR